MTTPSTAPGFRQRATKEIALLTGFLFIGLVVLPVIIYYVGQSVFGSYGGTGFADFFGTLSEKVRNRDHVAWFLIMSPYFGWQILRLMTFAWQFSGRSRPSP